MTRFLITIFHLTNDSISDTQRFRNPPLECRFFLYTICHCVLGQLDRVQVLYMLKVHPIRRAIFPLAKHFPTLRRVLRHSSSPFGRNIPIVSTQRSPISLMVDDFIKNSLTTTRVVTLSKNVLSNYICIVTHQRTIFQFTLVFTCIK